MDMKLCLENLENFTADEAVAYFFFDEGVHEEFEGLLHVVEVVILDLGVGLKDEDKAESTNFNAFVLELKISGLYIVFLCFVVAVAVRKIEGQTKVPILFHRNIEDVVLERFFVRHKKLTHRFSVNVGERVYWALLVCRFVDCVRDYVVGVYVDHFFT